MNALGRRLLLAPLTLVGVTLVTFALLHALGGDAATVRAGLSRGASAESLAALRRQYGLDRPLPLQYATWLGRTLRLDFGRSLADDEPVRAKLARALPSTLALAALATALAFAVAVPLGVALGLRDGHRDAQLMAALLPLGWALPPAALAMWLLRAGAPWGGRGLAGYLAPAACLALAEIARLSRYQRGAVMAALASDYIVTARAKGGRAGTVARHALANALLPMVTLLGAELPALLSSAVVVEELFGLPGLGRLGLDAVLGRDLPTLLGLTTVGALVTLAAVLVADLAYGLVDPRLRGRGA